MATLEQQRSELEALLGDKYDVLHRIGGGGMSQVYLVRHRMHGGLFAVKVLADHLAQDPRIVARFEQEARTAASLSGHPNIVPIFDVGEGQGLYYLIMQYVAGEDLGSYLRRERKVSPTCAANALAQTAEGLLWAESKRVVHRDLKPGNILLDTTGRMLLLDFGISKITDIADGLTRPGESLGTPYYMSPEQIRGEGCDTRSDLYSLGVVFFELLTGTRPFENESCAAIQIAHLSVSPPSVLDLDPMLPPACDPIVQKLMQKDRIERYQSPRELLDELIALGASSGPGSLRPQIDPSLATELSQSAHASTGRQAGSSATTQKTIPTKTPAAPVAPSPVSSGVADEKTDLASPPPRTKRFGLLTAGILGLLAVVVVVLGVLAATDKPQPVIADVHGRMLLVPSGSFVFGDNLPGSPHAKQSVTLPGFYIDETEVSNAEYKRFCDATGHAPPVSADYASKADHPVAGVTKEDADAYAAWAGKRLPTEEEWEKAGRGPDGRAYPWGSDPWVEDIPTALQPVDALASRKSPYGALNMAGNVFEWTTSPFPAGELEFANMQSILGSASFSKDWFTIKGGSFAPHSELFFRSCMRRGFPSDQRSPWIGFRCVRELPHNGLVARIRSWWSR